MKIGFIGIGQMGKHMSRNIQAAGYELVVNDVKKETATQLLEKGRNGLPLLKPWRNLAV